MSRLAGSREQTTTRTGPILCSQQRPASDTCDPLAAAKLAKSLGDPIDESCALAKLAAHFRLPAHTRSRARSLARLGRGAMRTPVYEGGSYGRAARTMRVSHLTSERAHRTRARRVASSVVHAIWVRRNGLRYATSAAFARIHIVRMRTNAYDVYECESSSSSSLWVTVAQSSAR